MHSKKLQIQLRTATTAQAVPEYVDTALLCYKEWSALENLFVAKNEKCTKKIFP